MTLSSYKCRIVVIIFVLTTLKEHSALAVETTLKATVTASLRSSYGQYCTQNEHCDGNEYCDTLKNRCVCDQFYQYKYGTCNPCPFDGQLCTDCCRNSDLRCIDNVCIKCVSDDDHYMCDNSQAIIFMTASQIALAAALIMGAAALATLLYRICTKPSYFGSRRIRFNRTTESSESDLQRISRTSLTSIQIRVISRLRDRPPKYETQHNYGTRFQRQEDSTNAVNNNSSRPVSASTTIEHAPPAYDGNRESVHESPPPYSDTSHDILPEVAVVRGMTNQIGQASQPNISVISNSCSVKDTVSKSDNKEDKSIHM